MLLWADRLFRRYQETGDPRFLGAVFDRTSVELLRVAVHLSRDAHRAEDLVQSTFLTAIEKAPQYDAERRVLPWLLTILANHARMAHRKESRPLPEAVANAADRTGDVAEQASARKLAAVCERALDALPEPYRHVLILHLRHGMSGQEIAHAMACPDSTVRNQIARGLDLLRRRLPAGIASAALLTVGRGLAAVKTDVMARVPVGAGAAAVGVPVVLGALFMSNKVAVALVGVALAVGGAWGAGLWSASVPTPAANTVSVVTADAASTPRSDAAADVLGANVREDASGSGAKAESRTGTLVAEVVVRDDGSPVANQPFEVSTWSDRGVRLVAEGVTAADGMAHIELTPDPGGFMFDMTCLGAGRAFEIKAGATEHIRLEVDRGWQLAGTVVDVAGRPVAGAEVRAKGKAQSVQSVLLARSAGDGHFSVGFLHDEVYLWAIAAGLQPSARRTVNKFTSALRLVVGEPGVQLVGRVLDEHDVPVPHARVFLGLDRHAAESPAVQRDLHNLRAEADGTFNADWLPAGNIFVGALPPDDNCDRATAQWLDVEAGVAAQVVLRLGDGARVTGQVRDQQGKGMAGVKVTAELRGESGLGPFEWASYETGADGRFAFAGLPPFSHSLTAKRGDIACEATAELHRMQEFTWNPTLSRGGTLGVRLLDPDGNPLPDCAIELRHAHERAWLLTDGNGACRFEGLQPVEYCVRALVEGYSVCIAAQRAAPGADVELRVKASRLPTARLHGRVVNVRQTPVADGTVVFDPGQQPADEGVRFYNPLRLDREGCFTTGLIPPGTYDLVAQSSNPAFGEVHAHFDLVAGQVQDGGDLVLPDCASLAVRLQTVDGKKVEGPVLRIGGSENLQADPLDGTYHASRVAAGRRVLRFFAVDAVPQSVPIEFVGGERREVALTVHRGVPVVLELRVAQPKVPRFFEGRLTVTDAAGACLVDHSLYGYPDDYKAGIKSVRFGLLPGTYHVDVKSWKTGALDITVPESGTPAPFVIELH